MTTSPTPCFASARAATSLQDLDIVRQIVEREGCLEALTQLLTTHARANAKPQSMASSATLAAAPMVVQSLVDQLRSVSVQIVEGIDAWKRAHRDHDVFQWRSLNYLAKMLSDTDVLAHHGATVAQLAAFRNLRLERNPFLAPLHLDHAALREPTPELACRLALFVGTVDMKRVFHASRVLLQEDDSRGSVAETVAPASVVTTRLHWSHRPVKLAVSRSTPTLLLGNGKEEDPRDARAFDVALAKELVFQHEHELGAMKEELAVLQRRLHSDMLQAPDTKRQLQTRVVGLQHDIKLRTGDLFHRRNELQRKEAIVRGMDKRRVRKARAVEETVHDDDDPLTVESSHLAVTATFKAALAADELRRQDIVDKVAACAKREVALSATKRKLQALGAAPSPSPSPLRSKSFIDTMTTLDVESFIASLPLGDDAPAYGARFKSKGIDGALLAQANDRDLEELGVTTRLHRIKILQGVETAKQR